MKFTLDTEQRAFADSLGELLRNAEVPAVARAWADGEHATGRKLWQRLAELGVHGLLVPEPAGGLGASTVDLVTAFEPLGCHAVPGPYVESVAAAPVLLAAAGDDSPIQLGAVAEGHVVVTLAAPPEVPLALDADTADHALLLDGGRVHTAEAGALHRSVDPVRRLFDLTAGEVLGRPGTEPVTRAFDTAVTACSAQLLGCGERLLAESVEYANQREQFGHPIGEYQALKHAMADVRVALDFARPLVHAAALALDEGAPTVGRDVSAAKVGTNEAAYRAARTALQVHGAIGYTAEYELSAWLTKVRALVGAWGTTAMHRDRVLDGLT